MENSTTQNTDIHAFKGFDYNLQCRGFQYEIGSHYIHNGVVEPCSSGFHSCENPFDVLNYYDITSRFATVVASGEIKKDGDGSKIASEEITIKAELKLPEFISSCITYLQGLCKQDNGYNAASGAYSQLAASGNYSQLAASGDDSQLAASGNYSQLAASGNCSIAIISGINGKVKGGKNCALALTRWVEPEKRYRITTAYVGENGIKEDTWYKLNDAGEFVEV